MTVNVHLVCPEGHPAPTTPGALYCTVCGSQLVELHDPPPAEVPPPPPDLRAAPDPDATPFAAGTGEGRHTAWVVFAAVAALTLLLAFGGAYLLAAGDTGGHTDTTHRSTAHHDRAVARTTSPRQHRPSAADPTPAATATPPPPAVRSSTAWPSQMDSYTPDLPAIGYGDVTLGMSPDALLDTGRVNELELNTNAATARRTHDSCYTASLPGGATAWISVAQPQVAAIQFGPRMATPEGIEIGSSVADLQAAYPYANGGGEDLMWWVSVTQAVLPAEYMIATDGTTVTDLFLQATNEPCYQ